MDVVGARILVDVSDRKPNSGDLQQKKISWPRCNQTAKEQPLMAPDMLPALLASHRGSDPMIFSEFFSCSKLPPTSGPLHMVFLLFCRVFYTSHHSLAPFQPFALSTVPPSVSPSSVPFRTCHILYLFQLFACSPPLPARTVSSMRTGALSVAFTVVCPSCWAQSRCSGNRHEKMNE